MTPDDISTIERRLGVTLPDLYRKILLEGVLIELEKGVRPNY